MGAPTDTPQTLTPTNSPLPNHLIDMPGGAWALWRWMGLRGAGFPAAQILKLAPGAGAAAADELLAAEQAHHQQQRVALDALYAEMQAVEKEKQGPFRKAMDRLRKGKSVTIPPESQAGEAVAAWQAATTRLEQAHRQFEVAFGEGISAMAEAIIEIASNERFQEAVIWQNRKAYHTGIKQLLDKAGESGNRGSQQRQHEELVANYAQRYCAKNDTIGFFGPVGWARWVSEGPAVAVTPGADLLAARTVYFESWCIDTLTEKIGRNPELLPWAKPRLLPFVYLDGATLYQSRQAPIPLSHEQALLLRACTGERTAHSIATSLVADPTNRLRSEEQIYQMLEQLRSAGVIVWAIEVPFKAFPEKELWKLLEGIREERIRKPAQAALLKLESGRRAVARAAGNPAQLDQALGELEKSFTQLTKEAATRAEGQTYAARTLVYEDCRRDIQAEIGPDILNALGPPLSLLLDSARWFTAQTAAVYQTLFEESYATLVDQRGTSQVEAVEIWDRVRPRVPGENPALDEIQKRFQERWAQVLDLPSDARRVHYQAETLQPKVAKYFDAARPGWSAAVYHCPDVMIAAPSIEAIGQGDYQLVMGEIHLGSHTLKNTLFMAQHPSPQDFIEAVSLDVPHPAVVALTPRNMPNVTTRTRHELMAPNDYLLEFSYDSCGFSASQTLAIGSLVVEAEDGRLVVCTRDRQLRFEIMDVFADFLSSQVIDYFRLLPRQAHLPRITVDRVVIWRESWQIQAGEMEFADEKGEAERFLAARRWARTMGMPRFIFVKTPVERKPFYVDFDSPIIVNILAKMIRRTKSGAGPDAIISLSEMLPTLDSIWLPDAAGQLYTSELRLVAVDQAR